MVYRVVGDGKTNSLEGRTETIKRNPDTLPQVLFQSCILLFVESSLPGVRGEVLGEEGGARVVGDQAHQEAGR